MYVDIIQITVFNKTWGQGGKVNGSLWVQGYCVHILWSGTILSLNKLWKLKDATPRRATEK